MDTISSQRRQQRLAIQRDETVPSHLRAFERSVESEHLTRLAADQDLVLRLQLSEFDRASDDWKPVADALIAYGFSVFKSWFGTGRIHARLKAKAVSGREQLFDMSLDPDDEHELAAELMLAAIEPFRVKLQNGVWKSDRGASLKTFFVGHCLFQVPNVYRNWKLATSEAADSTDPATLPAHAEHGPEHRIEMRLIAEDELATLPAPVRPMFELQRDGLDLNEIARELGTTEGAVRSAMSRARRRWPATEEYPWAN